MGSHKSSRRGRLIASAAAALLLAGGITTIGIGLHALPPDTTATTAAATAPASAVPPDTSRSTAAPTKSTAASPEPSTAPPSAADAALPASVPVRIEVPSIGVDAGVMPVGKQANGEVQTPSGEPGSPAGWYQDSSTPGQTGSSIILGHVNSTVSDIGLFYRLHELAAGQTITVTRADHTAAVFTVDRVDVYHKSLFPTVEVYQNADRPEVRLITCGGYDPGTREYLDNTVVYAHLTSSHPA